ncbi:MAG TPA: acyl-CoA dehydratase activase [Deltaproteobacteria bacterium]|nr:acyl-CoA dehydratase activase [Deltaproteobacteria bacterium]HOM28385.1 acyl-CoA dehydratase activase [Deltaproteobacteria bacterium]HPP80278.1 acyl-CoA dehydratase activase [Deltaproteobacteria bacterium]
MIVSGCDVGSLATKAVILNERSVLAQAVVPSSFDPARSADEAMGRALEQAGLRLSDIRYCVGTGYGRERIPFVSKAVSEIACHAKGAHWLIPTARTVIDIGGQDCKAIRLDARGNVVKFLTNDKCAAGTGRFLEVMARILGLGLEELGNQRGKAGEPIQLASTCTVWAQAEVIHHLNAKKDIADIAHAVNRAMAARVAILARGVGIERDLVMTGGVAKNKGVTSTLEELLGTGIRRLRLDPQVIGALGAAVIAKEQAEGGKA